MAYTKHTVALIPLLPIVFPVLSVVVTCGDPGTPSNGQRDLANQNFGTEVTYTCDVGYELEGSRRRTCQANGLWSGQLPECRSK